MKARTIIALGMGIGIFLLLSSALAATPIRVLARDAEISGKVVRLNLPLSGVKFQVFWAAEGKECTRTHISRKGDHLYEMRDHPSWKGTTEVVGFSHFAGASGRIVIPSLSDEIRLFLAPEQLVSSTVNGLYGHSLMGWPWQGVLFCLMLLASAAVYGIKGRKRVLSALLAGFVVAWGVMDLRTMGDHLFMVEGRAENPSVSLVRDARETARRAADEIGSGAWTRGKLSPPYESVVDYALAEHRYLPPEAAPAADYLVMEKEGQVWLVTQRRAP